MMLTPNRPERVRMYGSKLGGMKKTPVTNSAKANSTRSRVPKHGSFIIPRKDEDYLK